MNNNIYRFKEEYRKLEVNVHKQEWLSISDELKMIQESTKALVEKLQEIYGITKEEAERKVRGYEL